MKEATQHNVCRRLVFTRDTSTGRTGETTTNRRQRKKPCYIRLETHLSLAAAATTPNANIQRDSQPRVDDDRTLGFGCTARGCARSQRCSEGVVKHTNTSWWLLSTSGHWRHRDDLPLTHVHTWYAKRLEE